MQVAIHVLPLSLITIATLPVHWAHGYSTLGTWSVTVPLASLSLASLLYVRTYVVWVELFWRHVHVFYVMLFFPAYLVYGDLWSVGFSPLSPVSTFPFHPFFLHPTPLPCPPPSYAWYPTPFYVLLTLLSLPPYSTLLSFTSLHPPSPFLPPFTPSPSLPSLSSLLYSLFSPLPPPLFHPYSLLSSIPPLPSSLLSPLFLSPLFLSPLFPLPFFHSSLLSSLFPLPAPLFP